MNLKIKQLFALEDLDERNTVSEDSQAVEKMEVYESLWPFDRTYS